MAAVNVSVLRRVLIFGAFLLPPLSTAGDEPLEDPCAAEATQVIIQDEVTLDAAELYAGRAPAPVPGGAAELVLPVGEADIYAGVALRLSSEGGVLQGWSLSASVEGVEILDVSVPATVLCGGAFEVTEHVDPMKPDPATGIPQGHGVVSSVAYFCAGLYPLAPDGTSTVLHLRVSAREGDSGRIEWVDGMVGSGEAVSNLAVVHGGTRSFGCQQDANLSVPVRRFRRCDANDDGRLDISDSMRILMMLFSSDVETVRCRRSADCNGDQSVDISDPLYGLVHLFQGGPAPPAPYPECGSVDLPILECAEAPTSCN